MDCWAGLLACAPIGAWFVNSNEAGHLVQIKSSSLSDTRNVIDSASIDADWIAPAIERSSSLSQSVLRELSDAKLQEKALEKVVYRNAHEQSVYNEDFIRKHAKSETLAAAALEKLRAPLPRLVGPGGAALSEDAEALEKLIALAHEPQAQTEFVRELQQVPAMALLVLNSTDTKLQALSKLSPLSDGAQKALSLTFFQSQGELSPQVITELVKHFKPNSEDAENAFAYTSEHPEQQATILKHCDTVPFQALTYLANDTLKLRALEKLAPPEDPALYDRALKELPPELQVKIKERFPMPTD